MGVVREKEGKGEGKEQCGKRKTSTPGGEEVGEEFGKGEEEGGGGGGQVGEEEDRK